MNWDILLYVAATLALNNYKLARHGGNSLIEDDALSQFKYRGIFPTINLVLIIELRILLPT